MLLVLLGVAAAYAAGFIGNQDPTANAPQDENQQASSEDQGVLFAGGQEATQEDTAAEDTAGSSGDLSEEDAAQAVKDYYTAAAEGDYDKAWNSLSAGYQRQLGSQAAYTSQFDTLESVEFVEEPTVQVSGNTATVTGETMAEHTDRTERNKGTWTLVNESGEWKISGQNVSNISTEPT